MHIAPAFRRWGARLALALVVAIGIGYVPGEVMRRDPRTAKLRAQLDELDTEARSLATGNAALIRDVEALREDVHAIEDRARSELNMVYPDEIVVQIGHAP